MAKLYTVERWASGDTLLADIVNHELQNMVGEINGRLDRDNVDAALITGAKVALGTFHEILYSDDAGPFSITRAGGRGQSWVSVLSGTIATGDGLLQMEAQATWQETYAFALGLRVDGAIVARTAPIGGNRRGPDERTAWAGAVIGTAFVGAGTHTVELVAMLQPTLASVFTEVTADIDEHCLFARFVRR